MADKNFERRMAELEANNALMLGRLNGIASLVIVVAGNLPAPLASKCAFHAREVLRQLEANLIASNKPDVMVDEVQRIIQEGISILDAAGRRTKTDE